MARLTLLSTLVLFGALASAQTFSPFTAKVRKIEYNIAANGAKTVAGIWVGVYYRASDGTTMMKLHPIVNGKPGADMAILTDPSGNVTRISWTRREAVLVQDGPGPGFPAAFSRATGARANVNGVSCVVEPVLQPGCASCKVGTRVTDANTVCGSPEYGVIVHMDRVSHLGNRTIETVQDTYSFQNGEPDPAEMRIPPGFTRRQRIAHLAVNPGSRPN